MIRLISAILILLFVSSCSNKKKENQSKDSKKEDIVNLKKDTTPIAETIFSSESIRPCNMAITSTGRMFITINPLTSPDTKIYEIGKSDGSTTAYPNDKYVTGENSIIKAVIGIKADSKDNLWFLDMASNQFVVWDTRNEKLLKTVKIPDNVLTPASFLQDFVIDEKHNRIIIADMTQGDLKSAPIPAFVVIDTKTEKAQRMAQSHASFMPEMEGGFALNPITIDPKNEWIYYGALHGKTVYRVPTSSFDSQENMIKHIEKYSVKSYSDGIVVDPNQNVYITNIEEQALGLSNSDGFRNIAMLPKGQTWPDGMCIVNDNLYSTVNQLNRTAALNNGIDESRPPYLIIKTKL